MSNATARAASRKSAWHFGQDHGTSGMKNRTYDFSALGRDALIRHATGTFNHPLTIPQARADRQFTSELGLSARTPATTSNLVAAVKMVATTDIEAEAAYDQMVAALDAESDEAWRLHCIEETLGEQERKLFREAQVAQTSHKAFVGFVARHYSREELELIELISQAMAEGEYLETIDIEEFVDDEDPAAMALFSETIGTSHCGRLDDLSVPRPRRSFESVELQQLDR